MEVWKKLPGYNNYYEISNYGRVRSISRTVITSTGVVRNVKARILKPEISNRTGYAYVNLYTSGHCVHATVHRLVAILFVDNPNNLPFVNHKDENRANNHADNLEWCTNSYNLAYSDAIVKGAARRRTYNGEHNPFYGKHHSETVKRHIGEHFNKGMIYVNKGGVRKRIRPNELEHYLELGYMRGYK